MTRKDIYQTVTNQIIEQLDKGTVPWHQPWSGNGTDARPVNYATGKCYSGINVWLLQIAANTNKYGSHYWMTYKQAKSKGGNVKRGEHGTQIIYWRIVERQTRNDSGEQVTESYPLLRSYTVFNYEQCEKLPPLEPETDQQQVDPIAAAENLVNGYENGPEISHTETGRAYYRPATDTVNVPPIACFESAPAYYSTMFHELVHSTGHKDRLGRIESGSHAFGGDSYSREELVAEMGAAFLTAMAGIDLVAKTIESSAAYIQHWRSKLSQDKHLIFSASSAAQKAVTLIAGE